MCRACGSAHRKPGMFMLVDVRGTGHTGREFMQALYESQRVSVMDGGAFGRETQGFVRISFATDEATLLEACRRIRVFLQAARRGARAAARRALALRKLAAQPRVPPSVERIHRKTESNPNHQPDPGTGRQAQHQRNAAQNVQGPG